MVAVLPTPLSQQVLDEWTGIITAGEIRVSSLGCLRALVTRAQQGTFAPEPPPIDEANPLVRRMMEIAQRPCNK